MKKRYHNAEGCYAKIVRVIDDVGVILELESGEEAYSRIAKKSKNAREESIVLCKIREFANAGKRAYVDIVEIVQQAPNVEPVLVA